MSVKTILVALALEDDNTHVAGRAVQLANQHGAQLVGVHVVESLPAPDPALPPPIDAVALARMIKGRGVRQLQGLLAGAQKPAIALVEVGKPHQVIENLAASHHADLIVIGPGAAKNMREKAFGSTADRVVRCAPCPVLVVRRDAGAHYRRIAVGVDFSSQAHTAVLWAARLSPLASRLMIHSVEIPLSFEQAMIEAGTSTAEIAQYREAKARAAREQIIASYGDNGALAQKARLSIVHGDPALALLAASRRRSIDLVALGTQGASFVAQQLLGSAARKVLAGAKCDVLVIPPAAV